MSPVNGSQKRWTEMEAGSSDHSLEKDVTLQGQEALLVGSNLKASGGQGCPPWLWVWSNEKTKQNPQTPTSLGVDSRFVSEYYNQALMEQILLLNNKGHQKYVWGGGRRGILAVTVVGEGRG